MVITENRRILLNALATYGCSVYSMVLGLFSARWILKALGATDFGLFNVVGSIIIVIGFLNGLLGGSVGRYYAYAIGESSKFNPNERRDYLIRWFNAAFSIHAILPFILCAIGAPIGYYAIHNWLVIPPDRIIACDWVFGLSLILAFTNMVSVPYVALYRANQLIAELSIWGIVKATALFIGSYCLLYYSKDRLVFYSVLMTFIPVTIALCQIIRARFHFDCCRVKVDYLFNLKYIKQLFSFACWEFFSCGGDMIRSHGTAFLVNLNFGPSVNAAWGVSNQVSAQTVALSSAMIGALTPALTTAVGAGRYERMQRLAFVTSKYGAILILLFAVPLFIEMDMVLKLWLEKPPPHTGTLCRCILVALVFHKLGWGHHMAVLADGRVAPLQIALGIISSTTVILVWGMIRMGFGAFGIGLSFIISYTLLTIARVAYARYTIKLSIRYWMKMVAAPVIATAILACIAGYTMTCFLLQSVCRIFLIAGVAVGVVMLSSWYLACDKDDKEYLVHAFNKIKKRIVGS